jgi:hypothetical protein
MEIKTGLYLLTREVKNPHPDRRRKQDRMAVESWGKGSRWLIKDEGSYRIHKDEDVEALRKKTPFIYYTVGSYGDYGHNTVPLDSEDGQALWVAMEKAEPSAGEAFIQADLIGRGVALDRTLGSIFAILLENGKVSLDDIRAAVKQYSQEDRDDDEDQDMFWDRLIRHGFI